MIPQRAERTNSDLIVKDQNGVERIKITGLTQSNFGQMRVVITDRVEKDPAGVESEEHKIVLQLGNAHDDL